MIGRSFLFCSAVLLLLGNVAIADGIYQRTKDGKTLIWNDHPQAGDEATWSSARDRAGYARGFGTLTWYTREEDVGAKPSVYARYWGNMVQGKFNGPVNVHVKRRTRHAFFADGARATPWSAGPATSRWGTEAELIMAKAAAQRRGTILESNVSEPQSPAAGPASPTQRPQSRGESPEQREIPGPPTAESFHEEPASSGGQPKIDIDDSIRILVWPPRTLRWKR